MEPQIPTSTTAQITNGISINGNAIWQNPWIDGSVYIQTDNKGEIHPVLAFKYIKRKFGILEKITMDRRLKKLEDATYQALENGQDALSKKFLNQIARETKESVLYTKGIRHFISNEDLLKVKYKIKGGHISNTNFKDYTRIIPKDVLAKKKETEGAFDEYIIYHYYDEKIEKKLEKKQKMSEDEKNKMRDPILFGVIREAPDKLYFIADWEDEYCDLTFDEIIDVVAENKLSKYPDIKL